MKGRGGANQIERAGRDQSQRTDKEGPIRQTEEKDEKGPIRMRGHGGNQNDRTRREKSEGQGKRGPIMRKGQGGTHQKTKNKKGPIRKRRTRRDQLE